MESNRCEKKRTFWLSVFFLLWVLFIVFSLVRIQVFEYGKYTAKIRSQTVRILNLHPKRGTIYDRNGDILAISIKTKSAFLSNKYPPASLNAFNRVSRLIAISDHQKINVRKRIRSGEKFIWVKRKLMDGEFLALSGLSFSESEKGILNFIDEYRRVYPQGQTAAHVLGGVGIDEQALNGIEFGFDKSIRGMGGKVKALMDARRKIFQLKTIEDPIPGKSIYLTIDSVLQFFCQSELEKAVRQLGAKGGAVIVMDCRDGSILAMASYPGYSPEEIAGTSADILKNKAIAFLYDPGSTFKLVLASAALENGVCRPEQEFNCFNGVYKVRDRTIYDVHPYDRLSFANIIVHSSNIGAAQIGEQLGARRYYDVIRRFGFGMQTGIELPGEEYGILNPIKNWSDVSLAFLSFGYEISVTPIQMVRAFNVIATGGFSVEPRILKSVDRTSAPIRDKVRILSPGTVNQLVPILCEVVEKGTGKKAQIDGLRIAGKTGTTQKVKQGKYSSDHVSSFGGFFPVESPRITLFIMIDEPAVVYYGGDAAAPLFKSIAEKIVVSLNLFLPLFPKNGVGI